MTPLRQYPDTLDVEALPRRQAHALHALLEVRNDMTVGPYGPFTAAEICVYDSQEAYSPQHTAAALREAAKSGLCVFVPPGYWTASNAVLGAERALEDRFMRETEDV